MKLPMSVLFFLVLLGIAHADEVLIGYPLVPAKPSFGLAEDLTPEQEVLIADYQSKLTRHADIEAEAKAWAVAGSWERVMPLPGKGVRFLAADKSEWEFVWMPSERVKDWKALETKGGVCVIVPNAQEWLAERGYREVAGEL